MNDRDCEICVHKVNGACTVWDCKFEPKRGMTREEAKALLLNISAYDIDTQRGMKKQEAIEMAIKALEQEPCDKCVHSTSEGCQYDDITETIPPFDDCISRQAVLDAINTDWHEDLSQLEDAIKALPPVEPKTGHWIETAEEYYKAINEKGGEVNENTPYFTDDIACSECLAKFSVIDNETERFICCPNCGSKMESEET